MLNQDFYFRQHQLIAKKRNFVRKKQKVVLEKWDKYKIKSFDVRLIKVNLWEGKVSQTQQVFSAVNQDLFL